MSRSLLACALATLTVMTGCGGPCVERGARAEPRPEPVATTPPAAAEVPADPPSPPPVEDAGTTTPLVYSRVAIDLDGDGEIENLTLRANADGSGDWGPPEYSFQLGVSMGQCVSCTLEVHSSTLNEELHVSGALEVIDFDSRNTKRELLVTSRGGQDEDPPYVFRVVWFTDGHAHEQELWHSDGYDAGVPRLDGRGRILLNYDDCSEDARVTYRLGATLVEESRRIVAHPSADCAACPYVYTVDPRTNRMARRGEILRNLSRPSLSAEQALALGAVTPLATDGVVTIELREEKDETTFLDATYLDVDGVRVLPRDCSGAHCAADRHYTRLAHGEVLRLEFDVGALSGEARLFAEGYYVPN